MEFRSLEVGPSVRVWGGAWALWAGGRLPGQRIRPWSPTGFPVPKWTGEALACVTFRPFMSLPNGLRQGLPHLPPTGPLDP